MILLVTLSSKASECASSIQQATGKTTQAVTSFRAASEELREKDYELVVVDICLAEAEPEESDALLQHLTTAMPLYVNFAISSMERVVREVRAALQRRKREAESARRGAEQQLRNELKNNVTAILLSCEMALQVQGLPQAAELKLQTMDELAREMKQKLNS